MIKLEELKVDNWVSSKAHSGLYTQVHSITPSGVRLWLNPLAFNYNFYEIEGIPLTPEILEKCGFKYIRAGSTVLKLDISDINEEYPCIFQLSGSGIQICRCGIGAICPSIFFLHQLQNLYFALTSTELAITL